jgi:hypothetical protein
MILDTSMQTLSYLDYNLLLSLLVISSIDVITIFIALAPIPTHRRADHRNAIEGPLSL